MNPFRPLEIADLPRIRAYFEQCPSRLCERSAVLVMWRGLFATEVSAGESLYIKQHYEGVPTFMPPVGGDFFAGMETLLSYCRIHRLRALFSVMSRDELEMTRGRYAVRDVKQMTDWHDYLYESQDLIELKGRRYHGQRNHISRFDREHPDSSYRPLTDIAAARAFLDSFYRQRPPHDDFSRYEQALAYEVLENWDGYGQLGGVLAVNGEIISLSVGETVGDTLFVHIEKADASFAGAYQKTVNAFARLYGQNVRYINREEDMGIEGLRRSKLSYHPAALAEKYMVEVVL
ncbi:MAG: phosphatidylglycerol lysyltransferase domain-containing protein [Oscillospiraceae bacterium]|nr:phosphatidylglycerol lysyltransferase domain-containing protein [Oscillospiraceae bacterium]